MAAILAALELQLGTAGTGLIHVHLFTNNFTPVKTNVLVDFTELTNVQVPGYAAKNANWYAGVPFRRLDGAWEGPDSLADPAFVATGPPPVPMTIYGFFATDSTDAILVGSGVFAVPFVFTLTGDGFDLPGNPHLLQDTGGTLQLTFQDLEPA
jgi:hypothetical protein